MLGTVPPRTLTIDELLAQRPVVAGTAAECVEMLSSL